jgi:sugar O-acyltransferase (sialic acid O-acetyltransferase NeuD family)
MRDLLIFGAGYPDIVDLVDAINAEKKTWNIIGFLDDDRKKHGAQFDTYEILGDSSVIQRYPRAAIVNNVASSTYARYVTTQKIMEYTSNFATLIHPGVSIKRYVNIGVNVTINEGTIIGSHVTIGDHCVTRSICLIAHECILHDYVYIASGVRLAGRVVLKEAAYCGVGAVVRPNAIIGKASLVGAGAVVVEDVQDCVVVAGNPAKAIKQNKEWLEHAALNRGG